MSSEPNFSRNTMTERFNIIIYCFLKILPVIIFILFSVLYDDLNALGGVISSIMQIFSILYIKDTLSLSLVGLTWYFDTEKQPSFPFIYHYSKPQPYVPKQSDSNYFWLFGLISIGLWFIISFFSLFKDFSMFFFSISCLLISSLDFWLYLLCHNLSKKQSEEITKSVLLGAQCEFENVDESTNEETEEEADENIS